MALLNAHERFKNGPDEKGDDLYGEAGKSSSVLVDYVCKQKKWMWKPFIFDIEI
jgi:hypothetical protein